MRAYTQYMNFSNHYYKFRILLSLQNSTWQIFIAAYKNVFWGRGRMIQYRETFPLIGLVHSHLYKQTNNTQITELHF